MSQHVCQLPPSDGRTLAYVCPDPACAWQWRFNRLVQRWYRAVS